MCGLHFILLFILLCQLDIEVGQKYIAHLRILIPLLHAVDGLRKLDMICLVNAASIDAKVVDAMVQSSLAGTDDLMIAFEVRVRASLPFLESKLLRAPGEREYGVRPACRMEALKSVRFRIDETIRTPSGRHILTCVIGAARLPLLCVAATT